MFAELLNGMICLHNTRMGVDLDDERQRIHQPELRLGVIPAGTYLHLHLRLYTYSTPIFIIFLCMNYSLVGLVVFPILFHLMNVHVYINCMHTIDIYMYI